MGGFAPPWTPPSVEMEKEIGRENDNTPIGIRQRHGDSWLSGRGIRSVVSKEF